MKKYCAMLLSLLLLSSPVMAEEMSAAGESESMFKERWLTANKTHQYLGLGSIGLATLAFLSPKEDGDSLHHNFGQGAAVLGGLAVGTGLGFHFDDLKFSRGLSDPDNLHALLATLGAIGFALAVDEAPGGAHPDYGTVGALSMLAGIKITW